MKPNEGELDAGGAESLLSPEGRAAVGPNKAELAGGGARSLLNPEEQAAVASNRQRKAAQPTVRVNAAFTERNTLQIAVEHADKKAASMLLAEALGTADNDFVYGLLRQLAHANSREGKVDEIAFRLMFSVIKGIEPKDQLESMLAAQMAAVHQVTMKLAARLNLADRAEPQDIAAFNKFVRTFATQLEALKRYRTGGEQKVTVQHVSVNEGGQAIVGNVTHAARQTAPEKVVDSAPTLSDAREPPMPVVGGRGHEPTGRRKASSSRRRKDDGRSPA
jgi:hypothetical protein